MNLYFVPTELWYDCRFPLTDMWSLTGLSLAVVGNLSFAMTEDYNPVW